MQKVEIPISKANRLINFGPVVLVSSAYEDKQNILALAWNTIISHTPMLVGICVGRTHFSNDLIKRSKEFVINVPGAELKGKVEDCGGVSGREVDKFKEFKLTPEKANKVKAPLIKECLAYLECKVREVVGAGDHTLFIGEVVAASAAQDFLTPKKVVDLSKMKTLHHLGGDSFGTLIPT